VESERDVPANLPPHVEVVMGPRGLPAQRNRGMTQVLGQCDLVAFFDDDYLPAKTALRNILDFFQAHPEIAGANGALLADGIGEGGISYDRALRILAENDERPPVTAQIDHELRGTYGCNMVFRASAIGDIRFDENLPLYGWLEDVDFGARLLAHGRVVKTNAFAGVHRGVTGGRTSGLRLGFSQIVNPVYLARKGTISWREAARQMAKNFIANHVKLLRPEPWVDRAGRARGNWLGLISLLSGKSDPTKVLALPVREGTG